MSLRATPPRPPHGFDAALRLRWLAMVLAAAMLLLAGPSAFAQRAEPRARAVDAEQVDRAAAPVPLLRTGRPVDWWFVFKFNSSAFPACGGPERACPFGGEVQNYGFGQQFAYASSADAELQKGSVCVGESPEGPLGATFAQIYEGNYYYVLWNDQFYDDPVIAGCTKACSGPWGHSKGLLAWNDAGEGFVLQVSTPSWPASGSRRLPRRSDGNTLGCVKDDDVKVSQHFFALRLNASDLALVLQALQNASVVTDPRNPQIVRNGGPENIRTLVSGLGKKSASGVPMRVALSSGVQLISKPSALHVPPWQMVSSLLGSVGLRTATWWAHPTIGSTSRRTRIGCWDRHLPAPGPVQIATTGRWETTTFGLEGGPGPDFNHAKLGVSLGAAGPRWVIFGDMNQQGSLAGPNCGSSQNGRGGLFYAIEDRVLADGITKLIEGKTAPLAR